jgi:hypothetical protein
MDLTAICNDEFLGLAVLSGEIGAGVALCIRECMLSLHSTHWDDLRSFRLRRKFGSAVEDL